jgi:hypothetical protein
MMLYTAWPGQWGEREGPTSQVQKIDGPPRMYYTCIQVHSSNRNNILDSQISVTVIAAQIFDMTFCIPSVDTSPVMA